MSGPFDTAVTPEPRPAAARRVSLVRVGFVLLVVAALIAGGVRWTMAVISDVQAEQPLTAFAPYVDVTLTPTLHFEDSTQQPASHVILGFIVADSTYRCAPSWGTYYTLDAAARALDLDRRLVRLREIGGDATVSFGGAVNDELATVCFDTGQLTSAYQDVIDRYDLRAIDFDIEGAALGNVSANERRADAIKALQERNKELRVWLTLPVAPFGLTAEGVAIVDLMLARGVRLDGLNVMTMNYGGARAPGMSMAEASTLALTATWQQLDGAYRRAGVVKTQEELWGMIAATPMIGQNDIEAEVFTQKDARALVRFAQEVGLGRISTWSANRDVSCGVAVDDRRVSNTCSGVSQEPLEFARIFGEGAREEPAGDPGETVKRVDTAGRDDPRTSPYPLWRSAKAYEAESKVVWQGRVYQAKWYTQGDQPDAPVKNTWDTPWRYLGPVLESDREAVRAVVPVAPGSYQRWSGERVYVAGDTVEHDKQVFRAKWWTQGESPRADPDQPYDHPWEYVGDIPMAGK
ncbi:MAG: glycosyl hydrolase family 18 [Thermoflexaceae bacterium]|nr:glycosyl hydrolase family 18 [Thermoflexaceae bacterium]